MESHKDSTGQHERAGEDLEGRIAKELKKHSDTEFSWDKWYCECGFRLRRGYMELAAHQKDVERKLREEAPRG